jgi:methanogenic corrinoid protein MtbC1
MARESWVDVAGFSIGAKSHLDSLTRIISQLRRVSRNRDISIMVGGPLILLHPELVARVGADVWARDAQTAVRQASGLLALRTAAD